VYIAQRCDTISVNYLLKIKTVKTTKSSVKRKSPAKTARKLAAKRARPLHKRIVLHPLSIMVVLCAGVILCGSTYRSIAASLDVTASVEAPVPNAPAVIASPVAAQHVSTQQITVSGTCPVATYVKLYRSGNFSGASNCTAQAFQIQVSLTPGANDLQAKVYNVANQEGPTSPVVTIHYDDTTVEPPLPPVQIPTTIWVSNVEEATYQQGTPQQTSDRPTVSGWAPPFSDIVITFHSEPSTCRTKADATGWWTCTLSHTLPDGVHRVDVVASNDQGWSMALPTFNIAVRAALPNLLKPLSATPTLFISSEYKYQTHYEGQPFTWSLGLHGGKPPYTVAVDWGDDSQSVYKRDNGNDFSLAHAYPDVKPYTVFIKATDSEGSVALLQLSAVVKGQTGGGVASIANSGPAAKLFASVQQYLWIVWPVYIAVVLMVVSYWLGEQDVILRMRARRAVHAGRK
jgi:hypothetical protein